MTHEEFLALAESQWEALSSLKEEKSFYEYEKRFEEIWLNYGRAVLEKSISDVSENRKKKKIMNSRMGLISISKTHPWSDGLNGFQVSPYLQELQVYGGQSDNYTASVDQLEKLLRIKVSRSQMERLTKYYSDELSDEQTDLCLHECQKQGVKELLSRVNSTNNVYAMTDGSMLPTREGEQHNDWKEVKLGRIFTDADTYKVDKHHSWIKDSVYCAKLGSHTAFTDQFEPLVDIVCSLDERLVFVCDGAPWIWNWVNDCYPKATQVLDFYHALEHLGKLAGDWFKDKFERKKWLARQKMLLLNDGVSKVVQNIENLSGGTKKAKKTKASTLTYINNNKCRMLYKTFINRGLCIGSGAIESAHRVVLQKRLKQSGQRWTIEGAQKIIDLRVINMNGQWDKVIDKIRAIEQATYNKVA